MRNKKILLVQSFGHPKKRSKKWSFWAKNRVYIVFGVKIESHGMLGEVRRAF